MCPTQAEIDAVLAKHRRIVGDGWRTVTLPDGETLTWRTGEVVVDWDAAYRDLRELLLGF